MLDRPRRYEDPGRPLEYSSRRFWTEALALRGSATERVMPNVLAFGLIALVVYLIDQKLDSLEGGLRVPVGPYEVAGVLLGLILVARSSAGYDRWWEARKAWGGIVNQSRNLAVAGLSYGPSDPEWRDRFVRWSAAFCHSCRAFLRDETEVPELVTLLGQADADRVMASQHMPTFVSKVLAEMLEQAHRSGGMDRFAFIQADRERSSLIDHLGVCERIKRTPLAMVFAIKTRRFILLFLVTMPVALLDKFAEGQLILVPVVTMLVSYPILGLDQIGVELQYPFSTKSLSHLPINAICGTIEGNLLALLDEPDARQFSSDNSSPLPSTEPTRRAM